MINKKVLKIEVKMSETSNNIFKMEHLKSLDSNQVPDEQKAKIINELSESFDALINCEGNQAILEYCLNVFLKYLRTTQCQFHSENAVQKVRKSVLEMIHRLPVSEVIRPHVNTILVLVLNLIKEDNEENVLICLRIIIDLHKQYRPAFYPQIKEFLDYIHAIYCGLPNNMDKIFDPRLSRLDNIHIDDIYAVTDKILPKGRNSFKVLQELPIILVLMYQLYRVNVHETVVNFLPEILNTITLKPRPEYRALDNFNKELFVDFMGAQIKTLAFLAYTIKTFSGGLMEIIEHHAETLVNGMFSLLRLCLKESAHLRKELLVATRHILATNLRNYFVPSIELLFDENLLLGKGYTTHESLRPLAYSTLGDFIHIVRQDLKFDTLIKAVNLFSKNVHDETLPTAIHIMSIRLLLNLVDCIRNQRNETGITRRELLLNMLRVFILKFQTISKTQMPIIIQKWKIYQENLQNDSSTPPKDFTSVDILPETMSKLTSIGFTPAANLNIAEFRLLVKLLITGVKAIATGINYVDCENLTQPTPLMMSQQETRNFIDFFNWSIESFYLYRINTTIVNGKVSVNPSVQREEKELLELFSGLFLNMTGQNFQEIFTATIEFLIEKMLENQNLQVIINTFLSYKMTSPLFATVMVEFLLDRMEEIGSADIEKSNLYLKLFKLIFGSVSMFAVENEPMIRPYLQKIVLSSMEMAMRAEEPYNYFLLLRALFRSIGVGIFDMLYQEFLPLLPNLLDGLNRLQSGRHKQHMKDLFVELCLTVPVRLSSLLPFLPMLMDPLVSALNGSPMLVTQGLRTLELCVDNLQPDFFFDHIQPVRAELMQALWKTLRNTDSSAMAAFRILGKFGGANRNMLVEPQKLENSINDMTTTASIFVIYGNQEIQFPVHKIVMTAYETLQNSSVENSYIIDSWNVIRFYLASQIECNDDKVTLYNLLTHSSFVEGNFQFTDTLSIVKNERDKTLQTALSAMFIASTKKDIHDSVYPVMLTCLRQFVLVAIVQQAGPLQSANLRGFMDPLIICDALVDVLGNEDKEISMSCIPILNQILLTSTCIMGSKLRACALPMMKYLAEKIINLSYQNSWYAKKGACTALKFLCEEMSIPWLFNNIFSIIKAHLYVIRDLSDDVCSGSIDLAMSNIEFILSRAVLSLCDGNFDPMSFEEFNRIFKTIINELVIQTSNPHILVRQVATKSLKQIAIQQKITVAALLEPFKSFFADMIVFSPTKTYLRHQPLTTQIGILEANHFVTSLEPKLMRFDNFQFLTDVKIIIKCDDDTMGRYDAYKDAKQLPELRKSAMRVLVSWHYIYHKQYVETDKMKNVNFCDEAFATLFKAMETYSNLQETAFDCLKRLTVECKEKCETGWPIQSTFVESLGDYTSWTTNSIKRLSYYSLLFPKVFTEKTCDQLLDIVRKLLLNSINANKDQNYLKVAKTGEPELKIAAIIDLFHKIPAASSKYVIQLIQLVLAAEKGISLESSSPYREPMVKFLIRYPEDAINFLMTDIMVKNQQANRLTIHLLKHKEGNNFKILMENQSNRLKELILKERIVYRENPIQMTPKEEIEAQHQGVLIAYTLMELNPQWLPNQIIIINALVNLWTNELPNYNETNPTNDFWHLVAKILLHYFEYNPSDIKLLFQLLKGFDLRTVPDFQFLREFLHNTVCENYTVDWKREAFFLFVEASKNGLISTDLKIKILTNVLIPSFAISFERGEDQRLIRGQTQEEDKNVFSVFISKVVSPFMSMKESDDGLRIALLQFACLLVERASVHIHSTKKEDFRQLTTFGYSSLLHSKNYWDPTAIYNGHLLLSHIISTIANKKTWQEVVFKVFHSLLKAHAIEARHIVRQTLEVFMPIMPLKINESNLSLINLTKSVIIKDGYAILQLYHVFQVIIRHHTIYYPVRHQLIQNMINSMQRLESSNSVDYRKLAIDIAEVIINWELRRIKESNEENDEKVLDSGKRILPELLHVTKKLGVGENSPQPSSSMSLMQQDESVLKPIEWIHCKAVLNFLFELLFMLSEQVSQNPAAPNTLSLEVICKLSSNLLKKVLKKDVWLNRDENIQFPRLVKVFEEPSKVSSISICNFLEIFIHILDELEPNKILQMFAKLQTGLATCVTSTTTKVLRLMSNFLSKVIKMFPFGQYYVSDELQFLYRTVKTTIRNGLEIYEKDSTTMTSTFFGTFLILKTAFSSDSEYFKMFVDKFSKFVILLKNEHLTQNTQQTTVTTTNVELTKEMLLQSLHLLKFHISHMHPENRKYFINNILVELIEKSNDSRVLKTIIQVMEGWFKLKNAEQEPTLREKILLMQKLTHHIESRFAQDLQLNVQFLELIHFIYSDDDLNVTELTSKLDQAFISGLRCTQADVRKKFYAFFDEIVEKSIFDRLLYILTTKSWSSISQNFWIKQSVELLMLTAKSKEISSNSINLPSIGAGLNFTTSEEARNFYQHSEVNRILNFDDEGEVDTLNDSNLGISSNNREQSIKKIINSQIKFENFNRNVKVENFLSSAIQLCHIDSKLAEYIWITMFPKLWKTLTDDQRIELGREIIPFLSSGININNKETNFNAINTFVQALSLCDPPIFIPPSLMKSMSKSHNMYHRMALVAEDMHSEFEKIVDREADSDDDNEDAQTLNEIFINLSQMYEMLHEEDMWSGLWEKHAKYPDTNLAIFYERLGHFEEAQIIYESVLLKSKQDISNGADVSDFSNEIQLWDQHWIRCTKELNEWPILTSFAQNNKEKQAFLLLESAMKNYDWNMMKQALLKAEQNSSKHSNYKLSLYNGYVSMLALKENSAIVTKHIEVCSTLCLQQWRKLPRIVSQMHIPILQTAQQIMELQEASQIHQDLLKKNTLQLHDMKSIVKTWRNRLPTISDDLSHWNEIFTWRQYHYQLVIDSKSSTDVSNLGSQASAQTMIKMGKIARKHNMLNFAQKSLQGIESISSVPLTDVFHRIVQSVKCSIHLSSLSDESSTHLSDALKTLESIKFDHFNNNTENLSVLHAYRGNLLTYLNRSAEASKCFNTACELNENSNKSWALYGEYLEIIFTQNPKLIQHGISAMTCYLHASRDLSETKTRKYLSKVIWLLTYEEARPEMLKVLENHMLGVQTINWLPWVPQLLNCLVQYDTEVIITLLNQVAKIYPQAIYFSIRTIFLMLKLEQRERHKCVELAKAQQGENNLEQPGTSAQPTKSTQAMFRCSKIMQLVREVHPTIVFSLEGILEQMVAKTDPEGIRWFRENAFEENLHHLKQGLVKFYVLAFDNKLRINEATITQQTLNFLKKLVTNFSQVTENMSEVVLQDPVFIKLKMQFASGFDFQQPERNKLLDLIRRMKNCIRIMEAKVKTLPKYFIIEEKYRFLSNFTQKTAEIDLPGELLLPRHSHYHVKIAKFMPKVEIVRKYNTSPRRIFIRGTNGKIYPYLVVNDSGMIDARREERILQLLRMLNSYLSKSKETSRRFLNITVPKVIPVLPQMRLVEDNPESISLLDIYKDYCSSKNIDHDAPIAKFYERLTEIQSRGAQMMRVTLLDIFKDIQTKMIPPNVLKDWATKTFKNATDYWTFRKMFTLQLSLCCVLEYAFHLTRLNADMMYLHQDSGLVNVSYFKFDLDDINGQFNPAKPVPFRLTPNIVEFLTNIGITGPLQASIIATAQCFLQPSFQFSSILRTILRDEIIVIFRRQHLSSKPIDPNEDLSIDKSYNELNSERIINTVEIAVEQIKSRLEDLVYFDQNEEESKTVRLIKNAKNPEQLAFMDPAYHPWM